MMTRRTMIATLALPLLIAAQPADAGDISSIFTWEAFKAAQKEGKPIFLEIYAAWCPVCLVQRPIIEDLILSDRFKSVTYLVVEFDRQKDVLRKLNAQKQATLIAFKGKTEVGRTIGDTDRASIEGLMAKAM